MAKKFNFYAETISPGAGSGPGFLKSLNEQCQAKYSEISDAVCQRRKVTIHKYCSLYHQPTRENSYFSILDAVSVWGWWDNAAQT